MKVIVNIFLSQFILLSLFLLIPASAFSDPTSDKTTITNIRPYIGSNAVFLQTANSIICQTDVFTIDLSKPNGKAAYAAALAAMSTNQKVQLEISNATGCKGWGTELQSIYVWSQ